MPLTANEYLVILLWDGTWVNQVHYDENANVASGYAVGSHIECVEVVSYAFEAEELNRWRRIVAFARNACGGFTPKRARHQFSLEGVRYYVRYLGWQQRRHLSSPAIWQ